MIKRLQLVLIFVAGLIGGGLIWAGILQISARNGWHVGGEAFILPLFLLLIYFGWSLGSEWHEHNLNFEKAKSFREGYVAGIKKVNEVLKREPFAEPIGQPIRKIQY